MEEESGGQYIFRRFVERKLDEDACGGTMADRRWLNDLIRSAEAFRRAMVTHALPHVPQDKYIKELRDLEGALNPMNYR